MDCRLEDDTLIDNGCFQVAIFWLAATQRITWKNNQDELTGTSSEVSIPPTYPLVNIQKAIENGHWNSWLPHYINMVIFHSYVKAFPEGRCARLRNQWWNNPIWLESIQDPIH
jgi:hypothetical protein